MKKIFIILLPLGLIGCTSFHAGKDAMMVDSEVKHNLTASVEAGDKVSGTAECSEYLFFIKSAPEKQTYIPSMMSKVGNQADAECTAGAVYNAVSKSNVDWLIEPQYTTVKKGFFCVFGRCLYSTTKVIVTGYPAKIKDFN